MRSMRLKAARIHPLLICLLVGWWLTWLVASQAVWATVAQTKVQSSAPVVLDGRQLFEVVDSGSYPAEVRAEEINERLTELVESQDPLVVQQTVAEDIPVLQVNDQYVLSVTQPDATFAGRSSPEQLAAVWRSTLQESLNQAQAERSHAFLRQAFLLSAAVLLTAFIAHQAVGWLWRFPLRRTLENLTLTPSDDSPFTPLKLMLGTTLLAVRLGIWGGAVLYITNLFPVTRQWSYAFRSIFTQAFLEQSMTLGQRAFSVLDLIVLLVMLLVLVVVAGGITNVLRSRILRMVGINASVREAVAILTKYSLISVGTIVILQIWGLDLSSLALLASALGVGIGLGLQNIAKDFASGLLLVFERSVQVGEFVEFGEFMGTVERIGARATEIKTLDQISIIVPNSRFLEQEVINWSYRNPISRIRLPVGVAYHSDPQVVRQVLMEAAIHEKVLTTPAPQVFFTGFGDSALEFELLVWIVDPSKQWVIRSDLYFAIEAGLRANQIEIPFPQRDLHVRSGELPVELSDDAQALLKALIDTTRDRPHKLPESS